MTMPNNNKASQKKQNGNPPAKKKGGRKGPRPQRGPGMSHYALALMHPFSHHGDGCRVPDPYAQATVTFKATRTFAIGTTAGNLDFVLMPRTDLMLWQTRGSNSGLTSNLPTNAPAGVAISGLNTVDAFASNYTSYRLVAFGVRIKSNLNWSNAQGRLVIARVPSPRALPGQQVPAGTTAQQLLSAAAIPSSGGSISTSISQLPKSVLVTTAQLHSENGWEGIFHPTGPSALDFLDGTRTTIESGDGTTTLYQDGFFSTEGWQMLVAYGEGLTSGDVASVLNLEVVYHFEGIPVISAGLVPSGQAVAVSSPGAAAAVHQMVSSLPIGHTVREKAEHIAAHGLNLAERRAGRVIKEAWSGFKARQASNLMATMGMVI